MTAVVATKVRHPVFARIYARFGRAAEAKGAAEHRDELLAGLTGRVVEIGAGNGLNFRHYPEEVTEVVAVEPEAYLREKATEAAASAAGPVTVVDGTADRLPLEERGVDAGVASLVLCSVDDPAAALSELHRVIRPGGELRFYEHVRSDQSRLARIQRIADATVWPWFAGGCHASRDTLGAIEAAGFVVERCRHFEFRPAPAIPTAPHVLGIARRP